jgi:hypothetical protein
MTLLRKDHLTAENAESAEFFTLNSLRAHFASALSAVKRLFAVNSPMTQIFKVFYNPCHRCNPWFRF